MEFRSFLSSIHPTVNSVIPLKFHILSSVDSRVCNNFCWDYIRRTHINYYVDPVSLNFAPLLVWTFGNRLRSAKWTPSIPSIPLATARVTIHDIKDSHTFTDGRSWIRWRQNGMNIEMCTARNTTGLLGITTRSQEERIGVEFCLRREWGGEGGSDILRSCKRYAIHWLGCLFLPSYSGDTLSDQWGFDSLLFRHILFLLLINLYIETSFLEKGMNQ